MKTIAEQVHKFDRENARRMAYGMPEIQDDKSEAEQVAEIFNDLFSQLRATFPAAMSALRSQEEFNEFRRQWLLAFGENGITSSKQVDAGMRVARRQEKPFLPSPGQFVTWCRDESAIVAGLPTTQELVDLIYQYARNRSRYPDAESYPWKSNAHYWLVTTVYSVMRAQSLSDSEMCQRAVVELEKMAKRIARGETIPDPVKGIPVLRGKSLTREEGLSRIAELRKQHGLRGGNHDGE